MDVRNPYSYLPIGTLSARGVGLKGLEVWGYALRASTPHAGFWDSGFKGYNRLIMLTIY